MQLFAAHGIVAIPAATAAAIDRLDAKSPVSDAELEAIRYVIAAVSPDDYQRPHVEVIEIERIIATYLTRDRHDPPLQSFSQADMTEPA